MSSSHLGFSQNRGPLKRLVSSWLPFKYRATHFPFCEVRSGSLQPWHSRRPTALQTDRENPPHLVPEGPVSRWCALLSPCVNRCTFVAHLWLHPSKQVHRVLTALWTVQRIHGSSSRSAASIAGRRSFDWPARHCDPQIEQMSHHMQKHACIVLSCCCGRGLSRAGLQFQPIQASKHLHYSICILPTNLCVHGQHSENLPGF